MRHTQPDSATSQLIDIELSVADLVMALRSDVIAPVSAREVFRCLASFCDSGIHNPPQAWLMRASGYSERAVRDALNILEENDWLTRCQRRNGESVGGRTHYAPSIQRLLETVSNDPPPWIAAGVRITLHRAHQFPTDSQVSTQADTASGAAADASRSIGSRSGDPANASANPADAANERYKERARERTRPCPTFHPAFLEYPWPTDEMKQQATIILRACGSGLADFDSYGARILGSLEDLLREQWRDPVFVRCKVVPAVMKRTEKACEQDKRVKDFYLINRNIEERREQQALRQRAQGARSDTGRNGGLMKGDALAVPATDPQQKRATRIATCSRVIAIIEGGQRPEWTLDANERLIARTDTEAAFAHALERHKGELAALEMEVASRPPDPPLI